MEWGREGGQRIFRSALPYVYATLGAAFALVVRQGIEQAFHVHLPIYITCYPTVMFVGIAGGLWPGLVATGISALLADFFIQEPRFSLALADASGLVSLLLFTVNCGAFCLLAKAYRDAQMRLAMMHRREALRASEAQLQMFIEHALSPLAMFDNEMRYIAASLRWVRDFGLDAASLKGRSHYEVFPEIGEEWKAVHRRALGGETISCAEDRFERADGRVQWLRWETRPWHRGDGTVGGVVIFTEDITAVKRNADALKASEERYRTTFQTSVDAMMLIRVEDHVYLDVNRAFERMTGLSRGEIVGRTTDGAILWTDVGQRAQVYERLRRGETIRELSVEFRRKNGEKFNCITSATPMEIDGVACFMAVVRDVTELKAAEDALRASEERYRTVFETSMDSVSLTRMSDGMFVDVNQRFQEVTGRKRADVVGHKSVELGLWVNPTDRELLVEVLKSKGRCRGFHSRLTRGDGEEYWGEISASLIEVRGESCMLVVIRDVTETFETGKRLEASEARYRTVFESSVVPMIITRLRDAVYIDANAAFLRMKGITREALLGRTSLELGFWLDLRDRERLMSAVLERGRCDDIETRLRRRNGQVYRAVVSATTMEVDGEACLLTLTRDVTEAHKAEEALKASEERYRTAFHTSQDAMTIVRLGDGIRVDVNAAFIRITGYSREELVNRPISDSKLCPYETVMTLIQEEVRKHGTVREMALPFVRKNGEQASGLLSFSVIEVEGSKCVLGVLRDVTEAQKAAESLRASEERYRAVFETSIDALAISGRDDGVYLDVNRAFLAMLGYEREEVIGKRSPDLGVWITPRDREKLLAALSKDGQCADLEVKFRRKDGSEFWSLVTASLFDLDGKTSIFSVVRDVTEARRTANAMRASEERYRTAFQTSIDAMVIARLSDGLLVDANEAFQQMLGYGRAELIGHTSLELGIWVDITQRMKIMDAGATGTVVRNLAAQLRKKSGEAFSVVVSSSLVELDGAPCMMTVVRDLTEVQQAEEQIRDLSFYDPLTRLANRRLLMEQLERSIAFGKRKQRARALMLLDLDNFKKVNDTLGHETGDQLLREAAERLKKCARQIDHVARLSGDEFVLLLEDLGASRQEAADRARVVAQKVLTAIGGEPFSVHERECVCTCSIGIAIFGNDGNRVKDVLQQADIAMGQAKAAGRNTMSFFAPELQAAVMARAALEEDMRGGIKASEFELFYQPQVGQGALTGAEALVRWNHPRLGMLSPDGFISLAEQTKLILPLGTWVLETACRQIVKWSGTQRTSGIVVAVNISAMQLRQKDFTDVVLGVLERTGANPRRLKLELTESMLLDDVDEVVAKITVLKSHGVKFSVDDFGTGYSSLAYLKRLPLDQLKIDRSFVRDILTDMSSAAIARTIVSLGQMMGLSVIAEGVETEEQQAILRELGCFEYQGYLFSRPLALREFEAWMGGIARAREPEPELGAA